MVAPASPGSCPARNALIDFNCGRLPPAELETIAEHLTVCARCLEALSEIQRRGAENGLDAWLRGVLDGGAEARPGPGPGRPDATAVTDTRSDRGDRESVSWTVVEPQPRDPLIGTTVGPYKILTKLGAGGMGVVYRAVHEPVNQLVALKTIRGLLDPEPERLARFRTEGAALARLNHPNVVRLYHFDDHCGRPYFTMELVSGGDLAGRLEAEPLACAAAAELVRTLAGAVAYLHGEKVIHRDLKPHNVLLTADGIPKVSDLGLAKLLDTDSDLTMTGQLMGTPNYMSPEQAEGRVNEIGEVTDVYALGAVLYACLTRHPPFDGKSREEILERVKTREPEWPTVRRADVPADLEAVCLKCLEKDRGRRYQSADALADDLGRWLRGEPTRARPLTRARRALRSIRRNARRGAALMVILFVVILGVVAFSSRPVPVNPDDPDPAALEVYRNELAHGAPATLIPESGKPLWWNWRTAATQSQTSVGPDGTFQAVSWGMGLLELMPDPGIERFRLSARIRHERSDPHAFVGLYCGRTDHPGRESGVHFFLRATFDDIRGSNDLPTIVVPSKRAIPRLPNRVSLFPVAYEGTNPDFEYPMPGASGHEFTPAGEEKTGWHELALNVSPAGVLVEWDGQVRWNYKGKEKTLELTEEKIAVAIQQTVLQIRSRYPEEPFAKTLGPKFHPGGGVGIVLCRGQASFRSVTLTPLQP